MFTNNWVNTKSKVHYFIHTFCKLHVLIPGFLFRVSQQRTILKPFISVSMDRVSTFRFKILWTFKLSSQTLWTNSLTETIKSKILVQKKCHMHAKLVTLIKFYSSYVHLNLLNCSNSRACTQKIRHLLWHILSVNQNQDQMLKFSSSCTMIVSCVMSILSHILVSFSFQWFPNKIQ